MKGKIMTSAKAVKLIINPLSAKVSVRENKDVSLEMMTSETHKKTKNEFSVYITG